MKQIYMYLWYQITNTCTVWQNLLQVNSILTNAWPVQVNPLKVFFLTGMRPMRGSLDVQNKAKIGRVTKGHWDILNKRMGLIYPLSNCAKSFNLFISTIAILYLNFRNLSFRNPPTAGCNLEIKFKLVLLIFVILIIFYLITCIYFWHFMFYGKCP